MAVTPQTNATLEEIAQVILDHNNFCVCGHVSPDGDCIGSTLAMTCILKALGKNVAPLVADDSPLDQSFRFMPGFDQLEFAGDYNGDLDVYIAVDAPNAKRIGTAADQLKKRAKLSITIDHHANDERVSDFAYVDPDAASCTLIIWKIAQILNGMQGDGLTSEAMNGIATCCYAGLLTDTGRFMFQNTDTDAFVCASQMMECGINPSSIATFLFQEKPMSAIKIEAIAAERMQVINDGHVAISWITMEDMDSVGADNADTEGCINAIRALRGVDVSCMLKQRENSVRGSLRAKDFTDVSAIAREFGGGGHVAAAGFTLECSIEEALEIVRKRLSQLSWDAGTSQS